VLTHVSAERVLFGSGALMVVTMYIMLQSKSNSVAWVTVFLAGIALAPAFPTTLAVVNTRFAQTAATATGIATTAGWLGLVVSSPIIGGIAGDDPRRLKKALLVLPVFSIVMAVVALTL
jgi:cyanate permease